MDEWHKDNNNKPNYAADCAALKSAVKDCLQEMHARGFVHGDIRPNILRIEDTLSRFWIVDFDWAGPKATTHYPLFMNHVDVHRPDDVKDGELIKPEHDLWMCSRL